MTFNKKSVYLLKTKGLRLYKIGVSQNVQTRFWTIQSSSPLKLTLIAQKEMYTSKALEIEQYLHQMFEKKRHRGEWFSLNDHDIKALEPILGRVNTTNGVSLRRKYEIAGPKLKMLTLGFTAGIWLAILLRIF